MYCQPSHNGSLFIFLANFHPCLYKHEKFRSDLESELHFEDPFNLSGANFDRLPDAGLHKLVHSNQDPSPRSGWLSGDSDDI